MVKQELGKTYTMLGDYSKEIRETNSLAKRSGSNKNRIRSGSRNHTFHSNNSLQRNGSYGALPNRSGVAQNKLVSSGLHKQNSVGVPNGLPPKASGTPTLGNNQEVTPNNANTMSFESYIRN